MDLPRLAYRLLYNIIIIIISYTDMPLGAPVPLPLLYKGNRTI